MAAVRAASTTVSSYLHAPACAWAQPATPRRLLWRRRQQRRRQASAQVCAPAAAGKPISCCCPTHVHLWFVVPRLQTQAQQQVEGQAATARAAGAAPARTAREAALAYYDSYNSKQMGAVLELIAEDCVYEDLIYQDPFVGRAAIAAYFRKIEALVPPDIKFCVEDITEGDPRRCGVRW